MRDFEKEKITNIQYYNNRRKKPFRQKLHFICSVSAEGNIRKCCALLFRALLQGRKIARHAFIMARFATLRTDNEVNYMYEYYNRRRCPRQAWAIKIVSCGNLPLLFGANEYQIRIREK